MTNTIDQPDRLDGIEAIMLQNAHLNSKQNLNPNQLSSIYGYL
ncbi:hypothetical protein [Nostoc sp.]